MGQLAKEYLKVKDLYCKAKSEFFRQLKITLKEHIRGDVKVNQAWLAQFKQFKECKVTSLDQVAHLFKFNELQVRLEKRTCNFKQLLSTKMNPQGSFQKVHQLVTQGIQETGLLKAISMKFVAPQDEPLFLDDQEQGDEVQPAEEIKKDHEELVFQEPNTFELEPHLPGTMLTNVVSVEEMTQSYKNCSKELQKVQLLSLSQDLQMQEDERTLNQLNQRMDLIHQEMEKACLLKDNPKGQISVEMVCERVLELREALVKLAKR